VGSAVQQNKFRSHSGFYTRWATHIYELRKGTHHSRYLQNAWNKYGEENFEFKILEFVDPELCIETEQEYLDCALSEQLYNMSPTAGNTRGVKKSEAHKAWLSELNGQPFSLVSPTGELIKSKNLTKFAKEHDLDVANLNSVILNQTFHCKGWTKSLEAHNLYLQAVEDRNLTYEKSRDKWVAGLRDSKEFPRKRFNTKEEAKVYRDKIEASGHILDKISIPNWRQLLSNDEQQQEKQN
jgi:group I intron endonuclease